MQIKAKFGNSGALPRKKKHKKRGHRGVPYHFVMAKITF